MVAVPTTTVPTGRFSSGDGGPAKPVMERAISEEKIFCALSAILHAVAVLTGPLSVWRFFSGTERIFFLIMFW